MMELNDQVDNFINAVLPNNPGERIYVVLYNEQFVQYMKNRIISIKGLEYADHVMYIIPGGDELNKITWGNNVYISPILHNHVGNGYN